MKLIKQDGPYCIVYSLAMLLDVQPEEIFKYIGHRGDAILWAELNPPRCNQGIHIQELLDFCMSKSHTMFPIQKHAMSSPYNDGSNAKCIWGPNKSKDRFKKYLCWFDGILIMDIGSVGHACAWDHIEQTVYDPRGYRKSIRDYLTIEFWPIVRFLKSYGITYDFDSTNYQG